MLMKNPHVVSKIREEVQRVHASSAVASSAARTHADGDLDLARLTPAALPYTMATFYEGLRLYPPIPFEIKQVEADLLTLPDGTALPRGSLVIWCSWALNRSHLTWGDDADVFRPERWLTTAPLPTDASSSPPPLRLMSRSPSEFPVFHGGPRTCLGKKMAESMAVQAMAAVAWAFDMELAERGPEEPGCGGRVTKTSLTLPMEGGLPCFVREAPPPAAAAPA